MGTFFFILVVMAVVTTIWYKVFAPMDLDREVEETSKWVGEVYVCYTEYPAYPGYWNIEGVYDSLELAKDAFHEEKLIAEWEPWPDGVTWIRVNRESSMPDTIAQTIVKAEINRFWGS